MVLVECSWSIDLSNFAVLIDDKDIRRWVVLVVVLVMKMGGTGGDGVEWELYYTWHTVCSTTGATHCTMVDCSTRYLSDTQAVGCKMAPG